jgi:hypothetical protein
MALVSPATVRRRLRGLSDARFVAFVDALWAARGVETVVRGDRTIEARHDGRVESLRVVTGRRAPSDAAETDVLVLSRPASEVRGIGEHRGRVVDADDLHAMLLYAVSRAAADDLCRRFFDRSLSAAEPPDRSIAVRVPESSAPLVVGLLGIALIVAGVFGGSAIYTDDAAVFGAPDSAGSDASDVVETADPPTTRTPLGTESASFESTTYPPGLGPGGVVDEAILADSHAAAVTGRSYRLTITHREYVDGRPNAYRRETVFVASPTEYRTELDGAGELRRPDLVVSGVEAFADGGTRYERRVVADEFEPTATVDATPVRGIRSDEGRYADRVERYVEWYFSVSESAVIDRFERGGSSYYWIRLGSDPYPGVENSTGSAVVDEDGVVHEVRRQYDHPSEENVSAVVTIRYTDFGTTTVRPPAWHDTGPTGTANEPPTSADNETATSQPTVTTATPQPTVTTATATATGRRTDE